MSAHGSEMLRALGAGIRPIGTEAAAPTARASDAGFARMLQDAQRGELRTGVPVAVAPGLELSLSPAQETALSAAADKAEGAGASHALVLLDDMALVLDVTGRQIVDAPDLATAAFLDGIDAVVRASTGCETCEGEGEARPARAPFSNASLLVALARIDGRRGGFQRAIG